MARYFTKHRAWVGDEEHWYRSFDPHTPTVCDHQAVDTGLLDANGDPIKRAPNPIGFGRRDEW